MDEDTEVPVAKSVAITGDSVKVDDVELPFMISTDIRVKTLVEGSEHDEPLHLVTISIYTEHVSIAKLPKGTVIAYEREFTREDAPFTA